MLVAAGTRGQKNWKRKGKGRQFLELSCVLFFLLILVAAGRKGQTNWRRKKGKGRQFLELSCVLLFWKKIFNNYILQMPVRTSGLKVLGKSYRGNNPQRRPLKDCRCVVCAKLLRDGVMLCWPMAIMAHLQNMHDIFGRAGKFCWKLCRKLCTCAPLSARSGGVTRNADRWVVFPGPARI